MFFVCLFLPPNIYFASNKTLFLSSQLSCFVVLSCFIASTEPGVCWLRPWRRPAVLFWSFRFSSLVAPVTFAVGFGRHPFLSGKLPSVHFAQCIYNAWSGWDVALLKIISLYLAESHVPFTHGRKCHFLLGVLSCQWAGELAAVLHRCAPCTRHFLSPGVCLTFKNVLVWLFLP